MSRKPQGNPRVQASGMVMPDKSKILDDLAEHHGLSRSKVIELLILRGLTAYEDDGNLFDKPALNYQKSAETPFTPPDDDHIA